VRAQRWFRVSLPVPRARSLEVVLPHGWMSAARRGHRVSSCEKRLSLSLSLFLSPPGLSSSSSRNGVGGGGGGDGGVRSVLCASSSEAAGFLCFFVLSPSHTHTHTHTLCLPSLSPLLHAERATPPGTTTATAAPSPAGRTHARPSSSSSSSSSSETSTWSG